jgi:hypothetical protein
MWGCAFVGVCVLVGLGKAPVTMLEMLLFALVGGMAMKGRNNGTPGK